MRELDRVLMERTGQEVTRKEVGEYPLPVSEDWDDLVNKSQKVAEIIDRHLDYESKLQGRELRPVTLCPEQRISMVSDLTTV